MRTLLVIAGITAAWLVTELWERNKCARWFGQDIP